MRKHTHKHTLLNVQQNTNTIHVYIHPNVILEIHTHADILDTHIHANILDKHIHANKLDAQIHVNIAHVTSKHNSKPNNSQA